MFDAEASDEFIKAHVRRLEPLRRQNIVQRFADGSWAVPDDFEDQIASRGAMQQRYPARVMTLSYLSLDKQALADGATWLDRQLVGNDPAELRGQRFGGAAAEAMHRRRDHLVEQGLAERQGDTVRYRRNLLRLLRQRELAAAGEMLAKESGLSFMETQDGTRAEGIYRRSVQLASGKFAILEKSKQFTLVPWRPVLDRQHGKMVSGTVRGSSVSFEFARRRGIGIG